MTRDKAVYAAIQSLLDVVEELAVGLAHGQTPEPPWSEIVAETFRQHARELRESE